MHLLNVLGGVSFRCEVRFDRLDMPVFRAGRLKELEFDAAQSQNLSNHRDRRLGGTILLGRTASVIPRRQCCAYPAGISRIAIRRHRGLGSIDPGLDQSITREYQIVAARWTRRCQRGCNLYLQQTIQILGGIP
jgi:hypothetical protein